MKYLKNISIIFIVNLCLLSCSKDNNPVQPNIVPPVVSPNAIGTLEFAKNYGGSRNESGKAVVKTADGGFAILGFTQSSDGDITDKTDSNFSFWLLKYNANADLLWTKTYGGTSDDRGADLITTADGGFVITGYVSSNDGDVSSNSGNQDFWIAKLNGTGDVLWEKSIGYGGSDRAYSIIKTQDQGFLISGVLDVTTSGGAGNTRQQNNTRHAGGDYWVIKLSNNGTTEWTKYFGGNLADDAYGIAETNDGNFIIVGSSDSTDTDISNNKGSDDFWVISISNLGILQWEKSFGGSELDAAQGITKTPDGNFIIIGSSRSDDLDITTTKGGSDIWLLKITPDGTKLWDKNIGGSGFDIGKAIRQTNNGYIICGASRSRDIDISSNYGQNDALVASVDQNGSLIWLTSAGGSNEDIIYDAVQLDNGKIIAVGESTSGDNDLETNKGFTDLLILKLK